MFFLSIHTSRPTNCGIQFFDFTWHRLQTAARTAVFPLNLHPLRCQFGFQHKSHREQGLGEAGWRPSIGAAFTRMWPEVMLKDDLYHCAHGSLAPSLSLGSQHTGPSWSRSIILPHHFASMGAAICWVRRAHVHCPRIKPRTYAWERRDFGTVKEFFKSRDK